MTPSVVKNEDKCGKLDSSYCFLVVYDEVQEQGTLEVLNRLAQRYEADPIKFYYIQKTLIELHNILDEDVDKLPLVVVIKGKRMKYISYNESFEEPLI